MSQQPKENHAIEDGRSGTLLAVNETLLEELALVKARNEYLEQGLLCAGSVILESLLDREHLFQRNQELTGEFKDLREEMKQYADRYSEMTKEFQKIYEWQRDRIKGVLDNNARLMDRIEAADKVNQVLLERDEVLERSIGRLEQRLEKQETLLSRCNCEC